MAIACAAVYSACFASAAFPLARSLNRSLKAGRPPLPISISANPSHVDPLQLRDLLAAANYSCHRFPALSPDGRVEPTDLGKLHLALSHSSIVVSVFCRSKFLAEDDCGICRADVFPFSLENLLGSAVPASKNDLQMVGFGRAVSDGGLTASIHDVVVNPPLQRRGIGRKIVAQITRILTSRGIYDISALCSENERLFFNACGFGKDFLGSTTMMYTRTASGCLNNNEVIQPAGRMLLLVPPGQEQYMTTVNIAQPETL
ncbi:hypothetical protein Cni_G25422 [Canna indica]|uniref:N-acetyltransferase domain-containing protein n=1 Tax=Canna indica TaxID=4628 RepID=A0AAQ3QME6_9LILI|nr:hypothetical protein Cni_G25422 [Canna indica]